MKAAAMGLGDQVGSLESGKLADLLIPVARSRRGCPSAFCVSAPKAVD
jgi:imidazolonepropionase-like amidohydrolase